MTFSLNVFDQRFLIDGGFTIARGSRTHAHVVVVEVSDGQHKGRGECVPYPRYNETVDGVMDLIRRKKEEITETLSRTDLQQILPAGAARNAVDGALWDMEAKQTGKRAWEIAGISTADPVETAFTISLGTPDKMAEDARKAADRPLLKIKLGGDGDDARIEAVRQAAPEARLIIDANEGWTAENLQANLDACTAVGVFLIEQPLPAGDDEALRTANRSVPICADESVHTADTLDDLIGKYDAINIKLDKTGGLTGALTLAEAAKKADLKIMVGCMVGTSLAMAPAFVVAQMAEIVDLDGPLLLAEDRDPGLRFEGSTIFAPPPELWG